MIYRIAVSPREKDVLMKDKTTQFLLDETLRAILLCNSIVIDKGVFKCDSPDELCLISYCRFLGGELIDKHGDIVTISIHGVHETWRVVKVLEFTSERKRMSVLVHQQRKNRFMLYSKGADDMILSRSCKSGMFSSIDLEHNYDEIMKCLQEYADKGYRIYLS